MRTAIDWPVISHLALRPQRTDMDIRRDDPTAPHVADLLAYHLRDMRGEAEEFSFALDASTLADPCISFWTIGERPHARRFRRAEATGRPAFWTGVSAVRCSTMSSRRRSAAIIIGSAWKREPRRHTSPPSRSIVARASDRATPLPITGRARTIPSSRAILPPDRCRHSAHPMALGSTIIPRGDNPAG